MFFLKLLGYAVLYVGILVAAVATIREIMVFRRFNRLFTYINLDLLTLAKRREENDEDGLARDIAEALRAKNILLLFQTERRLRELVPTRPDAARLLASAEAVRAHIEASAPAGCTFMSLRTPPEFSEDLKVVMPEWARFRDAVDTFLLTFGSTVIEVCPACGCVHGDA